MKTLALVRSKVWPVVLGAALLFVAAQIQIPLQPVPVTLQTVAVMILGLLFERRSAVSSVLVYLSLGTLGFPVFAGFSNLASVGPRAGYLLGFLVAVWAMTLVRERLGDPQKFWAFFGLGLLGTGVVFACGVAWLAVFVGPWNAVLLGFVPFVVPGLVKAGVLAGAIKFLRS